MQRLLEPISLQSSAASSASPEADKDVPTTVSKAAVRRAGEALRKCDSLTEAEYKEAMSVVSGWRSMHLRPMRTIHALVERKINALGLKRTIVASRVKRTPSIAAKLIRFPDMGLQRMQDIAGVRAILSNVDDVRRLHAAIMDGRRRQLPVIAPKDYIANPKLDGYRGIHQVVKYHSGSPRYEASNGLQVEIQIRSTLQHYWATAVETLGLIEKSSFKTGIGDERFKQFFRLGSALFSIREKQPIVESLRDKTPREIVSECMALEKELSVFEKLSAFASAISAVCGVPGRSSDALYLIMLDSAAGTVSWVPFARAQQAIAEELYTMIEMKQKQNPLVDVVLASAKDMRDLKLAYPNYFIDTRAFILSLKATCEEILSAG